MQVLEAVETGMPTGVADARRRKAHARARGHSSRVRRLRLILPVLAGGAVLALAGALFNPFRASLPNVELGPVTLSGTKVRMENPRLSGFKKGERGYEVTANAALQDMRKPSLVELETMRGHIATDEKGGIARLEAAGGLFDTSREALDLHKDIRLWTDKGEEARLKSASVDFKAGTIRSQESVTVTVPSGSVVGDTLDVVDNGRVISFVGNVHAVFHGEPKGTQKAAPEKVAETSRVLTSSAEPSDGRP